MTPDTPYAIRVRHAERGDRRSVAPLLCVPEPGLLTLLGSPADALRAARVLFRSEAAMESYHYSWVAECSESLVAVAVSVPGGAWRASRVRTGLAMIAAAPWRAPRVVLRGRVLDQLTAPVPAQATFLACLAVDERMRGVGIGRMLLQTVIAAAAHEGRSRMALDVAIENQRARRFYDRLGFHEVSRRTTNGAGRGVLSTNGLIRLERRITSGV